MLLRRALEDTDRVAIVQFALREKTRLGALRIRGDVLVLQSLLWSDEVREASFPALDTSIRISAQEREMSAALVDSMAADFEPDHFTDDYQVQLRQLIDAKLEKGDALDTEATFGVEAGEAGKAEVIDLMEALKRSLEKKRGGGAASGDDSAKPAARAAAKSTAAKAAPKTASRAAPKTATKAATKTGAASAAKPAGTKAAAPKTSARSARKEA